MLSYNQNGDGTRIGQRRRINCSLALREEKSKKETTICRVLVRDSISRMHAGNGWCCGASALSIRDSTQSADRGIQIKTNRNEASYVFSRTKSWRTTVNEQPFVNKECRGGSDKTIENNILKSTINFNHFFNQWNFERQKASVQGSWPIKTEVVWTFALPG